MPDHAQNITSANMQKTTSSSMQNAASAGTQNAISAGTQDSSHTPVPHRVKPHRGRFLQIRIYFVRLLRLFYFQNDWKVLPMSALVAGLVAIVIRESMFVTMEGTLIGSFALACVSLWNGCFNSIQSICRERNIIKREHRAGMHISSYIASHFLYQALLCLAQTILTMYVCSAMGVKFPKEQGMFIGSKTLEIAFTIFLITFAADMLSLLISSLAHTTTAAMTLMPFILIFQLVFSGAMFSLPDWTSGFSYLTLSAPGLNCIAAQAGYNTLPMVTGWNALFRMRGEVIDINVTVGQILDFLSDSQNPTVREFRNTKVEGNTTVGELLTLAEEGVANGNIESGSTANAGILNGDIAIKDLLPKEELGREVNYTTTVGELLDLANNSRAVNMQRDQVVHFTTTVGKLIDMVGEDTVRNIIMDRSSQASQIEAYKTSAENVLSYWGRMILFIFLYTAIAIIVLEFIDLDKR